MKLSTVLLATSIAFASAYSDPAGKQDPADLGRQVMDDLRGAIRALKSNSKHAQSPVPQLDDAAKDAQAAFDIFHDAHRGTD